MLVLNADDQSGPASLLILKPHLPGWALQAEGCRHARMPWREQSLLRFGIALHGLTH